ncbi:MAG: hypothetical protein IJ679_12075 [Lachnospiraceae bacterium]|nr:hypothetical protein [Lachnospiraceae bacterium]
MKWKAGVEIERGDGMWARFGDKAKEIKGDEALIAELMEEGIVEDEELVKKVAEKQGCDDIGSALRLAQFVEDFGDYIAEGKRASVFGG